MKTLVTLLTGCMIASPAFSQDNPAMKSIASTYAQIEKEHEAWPHYTLSKTDTEGGGYVLERHVWISPENDKFSKAKVHDASEHGETTTEYYLRDGQLIFVFKKTSDTPILPDAKTSVLEQRLYFNKEMLIHALGKSGTVAPDGGADISAVKSEALPLDKLADEGINYADYQRQASTLLERLPQVMEDVSTALERKPVAEVLGKEETSVGIFSGIDEGDYFHWNMKTDKGENISFFIWETNAEIDKVTDSPKKYIGKKCQVTWRKATEDIPENGGKTEIEKLLTVKWIK